MSGMRTSKIMIELEQHAHGNGLIAPDLDDGITVVAGAGPWVLGNFSGDVIAAAAITENFDIHAVSIETSDTAGTYALYFYYGASDTLFLKIRFTNVAGKVTVDQISVISGTSEHEPIPAGSRVRCKCAHSDVGGSEELDVSVFYHTYSV